MLKLATRAIRLNFYWKIAGSCANVSATRQAQALMMVIS
jgi:hypothetical protein